MSRPIAVASLLAFSFAPAVAGPQCQSSWQAQATPAVYAPATATIVASHVPAGVAATAVSAAPAAKDIVDTAVEAGSFKTLVAAVQAAGLVDTLKSPGPFTVFAPTDEAFAKLDPAVLESLLQPENKEKLVAILTYHVVAGKVLAADVVKLSEAATVQGTTVDIAVDGSGVTVDGAKVVAADIETSNGVIHVIDTVILP
ncbi:MAG: fasciclin domain-containing protein [Planctomycetota bacterium]